ncbi:hypothetical protein AAVH_24790 [Aphelenchoides avenae]|nr:hypothetical protein AAVH_24790 [Aphelenchus avenae]
MTWADRIPEHKEIAEAIFLELNKSKAFNPSVSFQVLVYLPLEQGAKDKHCLPKPNASSIAGYNEKGVNYFVHSYPAERNLTVFALWENIRKLEAGIVKAVFSSNSNDLCASAKSVIEKAVGRKVFKLDKEGFSSAAVVRCGYEFVWYELGYRYFTAGRTAGDVFELTSHNDGKYNRDCGQTFLFP